MLRWNLGQHLLVLLHLHHDLVQPSDHLLVVRHELKARLLLDDGAVLQLADEVDLHARAFIWFLVPLLLHQQLHLYRLLHHLDGLPAHQGELRLDLRARWDLAGQAGLPKPVLWRLNRQLGDFPLLHRRHALGERWNDAIRVGLVTRHEFDSALRGGGNLLLVVEDLVLDRNFVLVLWLLPGFSFLDHGLDDATVSGDVLGALPRQELHLELQSCIGWNRWRKAPVSVGVLRLAGQDTELPLGHRRHALVPALDDSASLKFKGEGVSLVTTGIELGPIKKRANIVNEDLVPLLGPLVPLALLQHLLLHTTVIGHVLLLAHIELLQVGQVHVRGVFTQVFKVHIIVPHGCLACCC
mmetsp:Transcript_5469/g.16581  ORF Transcript_5469/g.16581 Transcript_5469/m.16581 type:complete len:354 (+) Transcript_5469:1860-2921(+)